MYYFTREIERIKNSQINTSRFEEDLSDTEDDQILATMALKILILENQVTSKLAKMDDFMEQMQGFLK